MKHINFFRLPVFMLISISISTTAAAQFSGGTGTAQNPYQIVTAGDGTYNVATAGTLATLVGTAKSTLTSIVLTGNLNGDDIAFIRAMAGLNLTSLDMSGAAIVEGGGPYHEDGLYTANNVIGKQMFYGLSNLETLVLPSGVTSIGDYALTACGITSLTIPSSVTSLGTSVFYVCSNLKSVTIPNGVTSLPYQLFYSCPKLTSVTLGSGVNNIGTRAFDACSALTDLHVKSATPPELAYRAFYLTLNVRNIYVPSGTKSAYQSSRWSSDFFPDANIIEEGSSSDITLETPAGVVYGDTIFLSGSSNNPVTPIVYTSSDESIAEISDYQLIAKGAGAVTITASQAASDEYAAGEKSINVTIGKKTLTVTADDQTRYEGEANPDFTLTYSGFITGDNALVLDERPQTSCIATQTSPPSKYPIEVIGGADNNYQFSYQNGTLTILQRTGTGINHPESLAAQVYPNPAKNDLFIQSDFPIERVELYSSTGVLVKVETGVTEKIDISPLTEGIYFVRIYSGNQVVVRRVVVKN